MSERPISKASRNATSLQASGDGLSPSSLPGTAAPDLFGQAHAPARRSRQPASALRVRHAMAETLCGALDELASQYARTAATLGLPMPATFGRSFGGSSPSDGLAQSLASRLLASKVLSGSPEYEVAWKSSAMLLGAPIFRLVASGRPISGSGFSGWPTPDTNQRGGSQAPSKRKEGGHSVNLQDAATLAGWPTPMAGSPARETYNEAGNTDSSRKTVALVGWATPSARDWKDTPGMSTTGTNPDGSERTRLDQLPRQAALVSGTDTPSSRAATGNRAASLNPFFSIWLMGFPATWLTCLPKPVSRSRKQSPVELVPCGEPVTP